MFGDEERHLKMRTHLVMELALHEQMYLDNDYLAKVCQDEQGVVEFCCIYSEQYVSSSQSGCLCNLTLFCIVNLLCICITENVLELE